MGTVLEKVKDANHFTTGYIFTEIKTQAVLNRLSNQKNNHSKCFVLHLHISSSTERGLACKYLLRLFWARAFLAWRHSSKGSIHSATQRGDAGLGLKSPSSSLPEGSQEVPSFSAGEWIAGPNRAGKRLAFAFLAFQFCLNLFSLQHR